MIPKIGPRTWGKDVSPGQSLRIVFMGTPDFAVPTLKALIDSQHEVVAVYTQKDRRSGRGRKVNPPPVKVAAEAAGIPVYQPDKMISQEALDRMLADKPDLAVVVAYGKILRPRILTIPPLGCINCHASILPKYRGAAPIFWAIANGETETGVGTMWMNAGMDTGPVLKEGKLDIGPDETVGSLHDRLSQLSADILMETIDSLLDGSLEIHPQDDEEATFASMLSKDHNWVDFDRPGIDVHNWIRALDPFPGARCLTPDEKQLKLFGSRYLSDKSGKPGEVIETSDKEIIIACQTGAVSLSEVQAPGRKRLPVRSFLAGFELPVGTILSTPTKNETSS